MTRDNETPVKQEVKRPAFTEEQIADYCRRQGWVRTGVFAKPEDVTRSMEWADEYRTAPVARVHGRWLHEDAAKIFATRVHSLAISYGLPELAPTTDGPDHYGILATGEFTKMATAEVSHAR